MFKRLVVVAAVIMASALPSAQAQTVLNLTNNMGVFNGVTHSPLPFTDPMTGQIYSNSFTGYGTEPGTVFQWVDAQTTGTGKIDSFLRVQAQGNNNFEQGYNTDGAPQYDTKGGGFTHSVQLTDLTRFDLNGTVNPSGAYYRFLLDINQNNSSGQNLLSMNRVEVWLGSSRNLTSDNFSTPQSSPNSNISQGPGGTSPKLVYSLETGNGSVVGDPGSGPGNTIINLDFNLNPGSGAGDMYMYIPVTAFSGSANQFVYLFSEFGNPTGTFATNDGIEEWATFTAQGGLPLGVPEPSRIALVLSGLVPLGVMGLFRRRKEATAA